MARFLAPRIEISSPTNIKGPTNIYVPLLSVTVVRYMNQKSFNAMLKILKNWKILASPIYTRSRGGPARILKSATLHWNIFGRIIRKQSIDIDTLYICWWRMTIICHFYLKWQNLLVLALPTVYFAGLRQSCKCLFYNAKLKNRKKL